VSRASLLNALSKATSASSMFLFGLVVIFRKYFGNVRQYSSL
jgi:hypothetical protein